MRNATSNHPSCPECGYDLFALGESQRCPECGLDAEPGRLREMVHQEFQARLDHFQGLVFHASIALGLILAAATQVRWHGILLLIPAAIIRAAQCVLRSGWGVARPVAAGALIVFPAESPAEHAAVILSGLVLLASIVRTGNRPLRNLEAGLSRGQRHELIYWSAACVISLICLGATGAIAAIRAVRHFW